VNLGPARGMSPKYLSPEHLALAKFAVEEASKRGMKVWIADEGSYPSASRAARISAEYPQLTMQGIVADIRIAIAPGQTISIPAPPDTLGALVVDQRAGSAEPLALRDGRLQWTAPPGGRREIVLGAPRLPQFADAVHQPAPTGPIRRTAFTRSSIT